MNIKVVLDTRRPNEVGQFPIKIRFTSGNRATYYSLGLFTNIDEFDAVNGILVTNDKAKTGKFAKMNSIINQKLNIAEDLLLDFKRKGMHDISPSKFKEVFAKGDSNKSDKTFNAYLIEFISSKSGRTAEIYQSTLNKIEKHFGKAIYFDDITFNWLEQFDRKLQNEVIRNSKDEIIKQGLEVNARAVHFRNIRAVFNHAIDNEYISQNTYPFRRFKIKKEETIKRAIKTDTLRNIFNFKGSEQQNWSIDIAKMIFFLVGINVKDLFNLGELSNDSTIYKRAKTNRMYNIWIEPELRLLLDKYKGSDGLIFKEQFKLYQSFGKKVNEYLEKVCTDLNVPKITTYSLRHSWATIAGHLDIPDKTIKMALGHGKRTTTDIYIDFDMTKVKTANRQIMNFVLYNKKTPPLNK